MGVLFLGRSWVVCYSWITGSLSHRTASSATSGTKHAPLEIWGVLSVSLDEISTLTGFMLRGSEDFVTTCYWIDALLTLDSCADRGGRLTRLHIFNAAFSDAAIIKSNGASGSTIESFEVVLSETSACRHRLSILDRLWLELDGVILESERADQEIQWDGLVTCLHYFNDFISDELEHGLNHIGTAIAHISNCWHTGRYKFAIKNLKNA